MGLVRSVDVVLLFIIIIIIIIIVIIIIIIIPSSLFYRFVIIQKTRPLIGRPDPNEVGAT